MSIQAATSNSQAISHPPHRPPGRTASLVVLAMVLFACNSILCRLALAQGAIDPASFMLIRLASGSLMLALLAAFGRQTSLGGTWHSAAALFAYAAAFSFAYVALPAGVGAFVLFAAVQATMVTAGLVSGNKLSRVQVFGLTVAVAGLASLVMMGTGTTGGISVTGAALMLSAGVAWGAYSLFGRGEVRPLQATTGNFIRALPGSLVLLLVGWIAGAGQSASVQGVIYAVLSGAVASGLGYTIWYAVLPALAPSTAASVQLSVPVITALIGAAFLGEAMTWRLALSSLAILAGIALVVATPRRVMPRTG